MKEATLVVRHNLGLHARPAALLVRAANHFSSDIRIENLTRQTPLVNAKSILSLLTLGVEKDHRIRVTAQGPDAAAAVAALRHLVEDDFPLATGVSP